MAYWYWPNSVVTGPSVCHTSEPCKNGWTNRDAVCVEDSGGRREPCIRWGSRSPWEVAVLEKGAAICKVYGLSAVSCAKTAELIDLPFGLWTRVGQRKYQSYSPDGASVRSWEGTLVPSGEYDLTVHLLRRCALCQITLTTCLFSLLLSLTKTSLHAGALNKGLLYSKVMIGRLATDRLRLVQWREACWLVTSLSGPSLLQRYQKRLNNNEKR